MKKVVLYVLPAIFAVMAASVAAQTPSPEPKPNPPTPAPANAPPVSTCPRVEIRTATRPVRDGAPVGFAANIAGGDPKVQPILNWSISAGVMSTGQGTRNIEVDSTGAGADRQIVVDLWVGGYPPECSVQATATVTVVSPAKKVDEFGELGQEKEAERLDNFFSALSPGHDQAVVIAYAGRTNPRGHANAALKRIKAHLVKTGMPAEHVFPIDGGFREQPAYELWLVRIGAEAPRPTPTVDRREIVYPKTTPVKRP